MDTLTIDTTVNKQVNGVVTSVDTSIVVIRQTTEALVTLRSVNGTDKRHLIP